MNLKGCIPDDNFNATYDQPIKPPPAQMRVEVTLKHSLCVFIAGYNETSDECKDHVRALKPTDRLLESFRKSFVKLLEVTDERITNMTLKSYLVVNESSIVTNNENPMTGVNSDEANQKFFNLWLRYETKEFLTFWFDIKGKDIFHILLLYFGIRSKISILHEYFFEYLIKSLFKSKKLLCIIMAN